EVEPVPGVAGRNHGARGRQAPGQDRDDAEHHLTDHRGDPSRPQAARRITPPPSTSSSRYSTTDWPGAAWSTGLSNSSRTRSAPSASALAGWGSPWARNWASH